MKRYFTSGDLRGFGRLALRAAEGITDLVEETHCAISTPLGLFAVPTPGRTWGIAGLVYRTIHGCYGLVGLGMDAVLEQLTQAAGDPPPSAERDAILAVVNGIWGDHLAAGGNPLALDMSLRFNGRAVTLTRAAIQAEIPVTSGKLVVLVHGLCMNDLGWRRGGHDHGAALARDLGYTPVYLHYNSGLHVSINGRQFARLFETLVEEWPQPIEELVVIGHSMGGLVARSACHYGALAGQTWPGRLDKLICLGTPHHGSPLERAGNWADALVEVTRYTAPFARLGTHRGAGITDLRYGNLLDEDWQGLDRFGRAPDRRHPVPLPSGVRHYAIGATLGMVTGDVKDRLLGDGVVPLASALGLHKDPARCLAFAETQRWAGYGMSHLDLLDRPEIYVKIREWLSSLNEA